MKNVSIHAHASSSCNVMLFLAQNADCEDCDKNSVNFKDDRIDDSILEVPPNMGYLTFMQGPPK